MKKTPFLSRLGNEQGQSVIEYTLILVVTVAILLALANVLFKPFGEFISNYMGKYTACLLEYGELPTLGSSEPSPADEDSECNKQYQAATWNGGRPPRDNSAGPVSSRSSPKKSTISQSSGSSGGTTAGSASRGGSRNINFRRSPSTGIEGSVARSGKIIEIANDTGGKGNFFGSGAGTRYSIPQRKVSSVAITGLTEAEKKELEKKAEGTAGLTVGAGTITPPAKKLTVKKPEPPPFVEEDKPFTIGNFIRYLFIAAIVIALVIFIGGQALQMSKSGEK